MDGDPSMLERTEVQVNGESFLGVKVDIPECPPLLLIVGNKGIVMCGYLNLDVADQIGLAAGMVRGVNSIDDVLNSEIKASTSKAKNLGIRPGTPTREALRKLI